MAGMSTRTPCTSSPCSCPLNNSPWLNANKTELLWIGSKRNLSMVGGSGPVMTTVTRSCTWSHHFVRPKSHVRSKFFFHLRQLRRVWTVILHQHSFMHLSLPASITVTLYLLGRRRQTLAGIERCFLSTQQNL